MTDKNPNPNPNNLSELDPEKVREEGIDPLTDSRTVAQTPTDDDQIIALPETEDGHSAGAFDTTTSAPHPTAHGNASSSDNDNSSER